jgi:hypothetical protein
MVIYMFILDYRLDPVAVMETKRVDMASADSTSLRYRLFPGDVVLKGEGVDFSANWGWVQVLDFALSLKSIEEKLEREGIAQFEFTESNAALVFRIDDGYVSISSTYAPGLLRVPLSDFSERVQRFVRRVIEELCTQHPRLALNPEIARE